MKKFSNFIIRYRVLILVVSFLTTLFMTYQIKDLTINSNFMSYLPKSDKKVALFNYVDSVYSSGNIIVVGIENQNGIISKHGIETLQEISGKIEQLSGVEQITGLTNVMDIRNTIDGMEIGRLMDNYNVDSLSVLQDYILSKDLYKDRLLSADGKFSAILVFVNSLSDKSVVANEIDCLLKEKQENDKETKFYCDGLPIQQLYLTLSTEKDLEVLVPIIFILIAGILLFFFRTLRGVLLPILSVSIGIIWTLGTMALLDIQMSPISSSVPVLLCALGSAYAIHILNFIKLLETNDAYVVDDEFLENERGKHKSMVKKAIILVGIPIILSALTTIAGFLSFIPGTYLSIIRDFGISMSIGIFFSPIIALTIVPCIESYLKPLKQKQNIKNDLFSRLMDLFTDISLNHSRKVVFISAIITLVMGIGIFSIKSNIDVLYYFKQESPLRKSADVLNKQFGGTLPIQIIAKGDITNPSVLEEIDKFQNYLSSLPNVNNPQSVVNILKEMNQAMGEGKMIPQSQEKIQNLWFLLEGEELMKQLVNNERTEGMILASMPNAETSVYHEISDLIDQYAASHSNANVHFLTTGLPHIYSNFDDNLMNNLRDSIFLSFILVFLCMIFIVKSFKEAIIGFIPLLITMIVVFGTMGFCQIHLDLATVLIAGISIGTGVDYSIHFITGYQRAIKYGKRDDDIIRDILFTSGRGVLFNVAAIAFGFLVLIFAQLVPLRQLGLLMFISMFTSGFSAMVILPSILRIFKITLFKKVQQQN